MPSIMFRMVKLKINSQGYTPEGNYYGVGLPVYSAISNDGQIQLVFRADNRDKAKDEVKKEHPNARFMR